MEGRDGSLWLTTEQGHVVRFRAGRFTNVPFKNGKAVFASAASGVYRIDSGAAVLVRRPSSTGLRLWTDENAIWNVDGSNVLRDDRLVFTLPERHTAELRAIVNVDDVPRGAQAVGARRRLLARPFTAEGLLAEVSQLLG